MAEPTQFTFTWQEVAEVLVKKQEIHSGNWFASMNLTMTGGILGPSQQEASPGAMILVKGLQLTKATDDTPPQMVVDAAVVNPVKTK